jgi:lysophospholipase L1-like esterase
VSGSKLVRASWQGRNAFLLGEAMNALKAGTAKVVCIGDSLTYGHDTASGDVVAPTPPHVQTHVPVPYPATLQTTLNDVYGVAGITVENRGFSGDTVKQGYQRWGTDPGADIAFVMYGINDAIPGLVSLSEFSRYLRSWVQRLNAWGTGVVLVPSTLMAHGCETRDVAPYRTAVRTVARELGCPVFDADTFGLSHRYADIYSDSVHFNTAGYAAFGTAVAAFIAGGGLTHSPNVVASDRTILLGSGAHVVTTGTLGHGAGSFASQELILTLAKGTTERATIGFFLDADAAALSMVGLMSKGMPITLDGETLRPKATRKSIVGDGDSNYTIAQQDIRGSANEIALGRIVGRGWHLLTIKAPTGDSTQPAAYLSAVRVRPTPQMEATSGAIVNVPRCFSVFDPPIDYNALPAPSSVTAISLPASLFGSLIAANADFGFYQSSFAIVEIRNVRAGEAGYSRAMVSMDVATFVVTKIETVGTNPTELASVTGPRVDSAATNFTLNLTRPIANYVEIRVTVVDALDARLAGML